MVYYGERLEQKGTVLILSVPLGPHSSHREDRGALGMASQIVFFLVIHSYCAPQ